MTTETQPQTDEAPPLSMDARMARMEAQQEIIIDLLRSQNARLDAMEAKFDSKIDALDKKFDIKIDEKIGEVNARIDTMSNRLFLSGLGVITIVGVGVITYVVNLLG